MRFIPVLVLASCAAACGGSTTPPAGGEAAKAAPAAAEAKPQMREVTVPAGTSLHIKLATTVASDASRVEDTVRGTLTEPIVVDDTTVAAAGTEVLGTVVEAKRSGRVTGRAEVAVDFNRLRIGNETHNIRTGEIVDEAPATKKKDAEKVGIGAGAGAVIGAIAGGKKGALVGGAIGAGAGGADVAATRGDEVRLAAGRTIVTKLQDPLTVRVAR